MTDSDCGIAAAVFLHKQVGKRLSYDIAAADYDNMLTFCRNFIISEKLKYTMGCTGQKCLLTKYQPADIVRMKSVYILGW